MWPSWVKSVLRTMVKACKWPSGPRDSRAKDPSLCGSNIREPDYLRHWYSGWGNCGSLMLLLQGRAETRKACAKAQKKVCFLLNLFLFLSFSFFCFWQEGWERPVGKIVIPTLHKKNCFLLNFFFFLFFSFFFCFWQEGWERPIGKIVIPTLHKKKFVFF